MSKEKGKKNSLGKKTPVRTLKEKRALKAAKRREKDGKNLLDIKAPIKTLTEKKVAKGTKQKK